MYANGHGAQTLEGSEHVWARSAAILHISRGALVKMWGEIPA